jgi:hypothetical protein
LEVVTEEIQHQFLLSWTDTKLPSLKVGDNRVLVDALRVLLPPYTGPEVRLYRGASAREAKARKLFGPAWSADIKTAESFALQYQSWPGGSVLLKTLAPPDAILCSPHLVETYFMDNDGDRLYDEHEYIVDGRRLRSVTVRRRYPQISFEEACRREAQP